MKAALKRRVATDLAEEQKAAPDNGADGTAGTASHSTKKSRGGSPLAARAGHHRKQPIAGSRSEELWTACTAVCHDSHTQEVQARRSDVMCEASIEALRASSYVGTANLHSTVETPAAAMPPPPPRINHSALRTRAEKMLLGRGERPIASRIDKVATEATYGLVIAVSDVASQLWQARQDDIKAACARLIDEVDVMAYLMADTMGRPLMHYEDTNAVGKRIAITAKRVRGRGRDAEIYSGLNLPDRTIGGRVKDLDSKQLADAAEAAAIAAEAPWEAAMAAREVAFQRFEKAATKMEELQQAVRDGEDHVFGSPSWKAAESKLQQAHLDLDSSYDVATAAGEKLCERRKEVWSRQCVVVTEAEAREAEAKEARDAAMATRWDAELKCNPALREAASITPGLREAWIRRGICVESSDDDESGSDVAEA